VLICGAHSNAARPITAHLLLVGRKYGKVNISVRPTRVD
jgi:hypothetical protein